MRSRGLELEARGKLADQFSIIGSMTWQNVQYVQDNDRAVIGKTPLRIPARFGSLWINWEAPEISMVAGLGAGVGGRFSNGTKGGTMDNQFNTTGHGVMDAEVHYDIGHLAHRAASTAQNARLPRN